MTTVNMTVVTTHMTADNMTVVTIHMTTDYMTVPVVTTHMILIVTIHMTADNMKNRRNTHDRRYIKIGNYINHVRKEHPVIYFG